MEPREFKLPPQDYWPQLQAEDQLEPATVKLFDITRSMSQRIEGQYRRHWAFLPGLWNLYFRECINLGISLKHGTRVAAGEAASAKEQDAAVAAAGLYERLHSGTNRDQHGKRRKIEGDTSKLMFADGITPLPKRLLADFRFRTRSVSGTQEIRTKIGHVGFWGVSSVRQWYLHDSVARGAP